MKLRVPITIFDELDETVIKSSGQLDLASGEIHSVRYEDYDVDAEGVPATAEDYAFTSGTLSHEGKDVEFRVDVDVFSGAYSVSATELLDIKVRAAKLFAGIEGKDILGGGKAGGDGKTIH